MLAQQISDPIVEIEACKALMKTGSDADFILLVDALLPLWEAIRDSKLTSDEAQVRATTALPLLRQVRELYSEAEAAGKPMNLSASTRQSICEDMEHAFGFSSGVDDPAVIRARHQMTRRLLAMTPTPAPTTTTPTVPEPAPPGKEGSALPWILGGLAAIGVIGGIAWYLKKKGPTRARLRGADEPEPGVIDTTAEVLSVKRHAHQEDDQT